MTSTRRRLATADAECNRLDDQGATRQNEFVKVLCKCTIRNGGVRYLAKRKNSDFGTWVPPEKLPPDLLERANSVFTDFLSRTKKRPRKQANPTKKISETFVMIKSAAAENIPWHNEALSSDSTPGRSRIMDFRLWKENEDIDPRFKRLSLDDAVEEIPGDLEAQRSEKLMRAILKAVADIEEGEELPAEDADVFIRLPRRDVWIDYDAGYEIEFTPSSNAGSVDLDVPENTDDDNRLNLHDRADANARLSNITQPENTPVASSSNSGGKPSATKTKQQPKVHSDRTPRSKANRKDSVEEEGSPLRKRPRGAATVKQIPVDATASRLRNGKRRLDGEKSTPLKSTSARKRQKSPEQKTKTVSPPQLPNIPGLNFSLGPPSKTPSFKIPKKNGQVDHQPSFNTPQAIKQGPKRSYR